MRTITYYCNRCKKKITGRAAVKINANIQRGFDPAEKSSYDFCSSCFMFIKLAFSDALCMDSSGETTDLSEDEGAEEQKHEGKTDSLNKKMRESLVTGPLTDEERMEILRLSIEEDLSSEKIAERMRRLPKGIIRYLNKVKKNGEYDKQKEAFEKTAGKKKIDASDVDKFFSGDGYEGVPKEEYIMGKRYDVGGILALHTAGWKPSTIAWEKHLDEDGVRMILDKYATM